MTAKQAGKTSKEFRNQAKKERKALQKEDLKKSTKEFQLQKM